MTRICAVIFDWAGTTVDFGCVAPTGAFIAAFAARGVTVTQAEVRRPMGLHKKDHVRAMLATPAVAAKWHAALGRDWTEADVEDLYRLVTPLQIEAAARHGQLVPGLQEAVARLRKRGIRIGATTGYFREAAEACYTTARQQGYAPDFTICADEVPRGRPAPWMIFRCMEALDAYPPASVVKVGDTIPDIGEGQNAGTWSVAVSDSSSAMGLTEAEFAALDAVERDQRRTAVRAPFEAAGADFVIHGLRELTGVIDAIQRSEHESEPEASARGR